MIVVQNVDSCMINTNCFLKEQNDFLKKKLRLKMRIILLLLFVCFAICHVCNPAEKFQEYKRSVELFRNLQLRAVAENDDILFEHLYFAAPKVKKMYHDFLNCTIEYYQNWINDLK